MIFAASCIFPFRLVLTRPSEYTHAVVNVYYIISNFKSGKIVQGDLFAFLNQTFQVNPVNSLEKLMICVITDFIAVICKTFV